MALWGGRFSQGAHEEFKAFNDSLKIDYRLATFDIQGSIAWAKALREVGVLSQNERSELVNALESLSESVFKNPNQILESDAEDIHSWVEEQLIELVGDLGKKLHTGRSRNDQVATDLKLWCKYAIDQLSSALISCQSEILSLAKRESDTVIPGYTHLQRAQPVYFSHWCLAYVEMLQRDVTRLADAKCRLDTSPFGCGALAGTAYAIDREALACDLGFDSAALNSLDAVSDRDHIIEILSAASISMMHLSRLAEDLIFYNSGEAGFIEMSDVVTSGSSLMPQKKNPDACELIRGKTGRVFGSLTGMLTVMKGLSLAYNKDMQEDKEGLFDTVDTWLASLNMMSLVIEGVKVNHKRARLAAQQGYANSTELADYLVNKGVPFREAHHLVGEVVVYAIEQGQALEDLPLPTLQNFHQSIASDVYEHLSLEATLNKRVALGGTSKAQVTKALSNALKRVNGNEP